MGWSLYPGPPKSEYFIDAQGRTKVTVFSTDFIISDHRLPFWAPGSSPDGGDLVIHSWWSCVCSGVCFASSTSLLTAGPTVQIRDQLLSFRHSAMLRKENMFLTSWEVVRGNRAGALCWAKNRGNLRSLPDKLDMLAALTRHQREFWECSTILSWLMELTPDLSVALDFSWCGETGGGRGLGTNYSLDKLMK